MGTMTGRERLLAVFRGKAPDRIPWAPLVDGYFLASLDGEINAVEALRMIGADILERHVPTYRSIGNKNLTKTQLATAKREKSNGAIITVETIGDCQVETHSEGGKICQEISTPIGVLTGRWVFTATSPYIPFAVERRIKEPKDLRVYRHFVRQNRFEPCYDVFSREDEYVGDDGLATTSVPCTPFQILLENELGLEQFYYFLQDYPDEIEETLAVLHDQNKEIYRIAAESPAEVVIDHENTSTTLMSPALYERYCLKEINEYADILHERNKIFLTHMCGTLKGLKNELGKGRMDGIIDIAPFPTGDVDLAEAKEMWGPDKVVMGGIDATSFASLSPEDMREHVRSLLHRVSPGDGVIIGSGDAVPISAKMDSLQAISEVISEYGSYPLSVK